VRRAYKGTGRVSPELMAEAVRLRRAGPTRSAAQITDIIAAPMACFYPKRTVRAHLARSGVSRRELTSEPARARRTFRGFTAPTRSGSGDSSSDLSSPTRAGRLTAGKLFLAC